MYHTQTISSLDHHHHWHHKDNSLQRMTSMSCYINIIIVIIIIIIIINVAPFQHPALVSSLRFVGTRRLLHCNNFKTYCHLFYLLSVSLLALLPRVTANKSHCDVAVPSFPLQFVDVNLLTCSDRTNTQVAINLPIHGTWHMGAKIRTFLY
jgi:hypothetical protein